MNAYQEYAKQLVKEKIYKRRAKSMKIAILASTVMEYANNNFKKVSLVLMISNARIIWLAQTKNARDLVEYSMVKFLTTN
jgi:hypothetical protein